MKNWKTLKKELLKENNVKREYETLKPRYQLITELIEARRKKGITQTELAKRIGTKQTAIARIESGRANPTLLFLEKLASALDTKLTIHFG
ncbi:MAG: Transcriptional regulator, XRE family [Candidatus Woesebacteria bacterium GW2011_GWB1_38_5]|nr:MAG: Transcriptional regulator, XRE family [Candidatus Woesebacteria bacterium GW2011_GWD1_38_10]KKQ73960.1 MAG: Transcriptional regulator, XRE family [Candidatus Woesebacteria bacterium GW2011_GWB1_38_5]KKQ74921.1 MAG: Transcriptional regulator, XRE family [Microgenomates group bacterium GW2011_GWF1_38_5]